MEEKCEFGTADANWDNKFSDKIFFSLFRNVCTSIDAEFEGELIDVQGLGFYYVIWAFFEK